jgi:hypothetical protein
MANGGQVTTKDVADYIRWHLQDFSFKTMVGGGYVHTDLSDPMVFENVEVTPENSYYGSEGVYLNYIEIRAKDISDTINWFFANCYNFDEIYGQNDEEYADEQPVNESLKKAIKESITKVLNEWGFPDNMDYNVETKDTPVDEIQKYTYDDVKSSYDPSDIAIAFRNMAISNDDAEFVAAIGEALLSEDGLTDNDERRKILGIQQDYQQARMKIRVLLNMVKKGSIKGAFERYKNDIPNRS